jgi:membrane-bound lytic murein transglycosylase MltF
MNADIAVVFGILGVAGIVFASGRVRLDVTALLVVMALMLSGVLTPREALAGFGDPVVLLVAGLLVVGEMLTRTGVSYAMGRWLLRVGGSSETRLLVLLMLAGSLLAPASPRADEPGPSAVLRIPNESFTGDLDEMRERRLVRVLVPFSKMFYFLDGADQRGITYEVVQKLDAWLNENLGTGHLKLRFVIVPTPRDRLIPGLVEGRGDIAMGNLTITPERQALVDFSDPVLTGVSEILMTGPSAAAITGLDELSGREVHVRRSSSYYESLVRLNRRFEAEGRPPVRIVSADERLEDDDLIEMVSAGMLPAIVVDDHKARFWAQIFEGVTLHPEIAVATGQSIAWAFRKNSPELRAHLNAFASTVKKGTLLGNILFKRYLVSAGWARNALSDQDRARFQETIGLFKDYAGRYGFDWLMVAALAYQESRLDQNVRSAAGAVGVMQVLPTTAADPKVGIEGIEQLENNVHAGVKYLRFLKDRYFDDPAIDPVDRTLFTFAAYNAGPAKVRRLRAEAESVGLDPNLWFQNVEVIAARRIGRETVQYVSNIYKYYVAYRLIADQALGR